jgi:flagellin-like protein
MKKRSFIREDEKAVSPVIATILMVAITVVLAAVLYIMVIGLAPTTGEQAPTGVFASAGATSNTTATVEFAGFSVTPAPINLKIVVSQTGSSGTYTFGANADGTVLSLEAGTSQGTLTYRDYADNDLVNGGDQILMTGLTKSTTYEVKMLWKDGTILDTESFNTPA